MDELIIAKIIALAWQQTFEDALKELLRKLKEMK